MFNKELFEIGENALKSINLKDIQKRNKKMEEEVLKIIKNHSYAIDENGIAEMIIYSKDYKSNNHEYEVLKSIIDTGRQKYFEDEYSLYFISDERVEAYADVFHVITFIWNGFEYMVKNKPEAKGK